MREDQSVAEMANEDRDRKRKARTFKSSRGSDTPLTMPPKIP